MNFNNLFINVNIKFIILIKYNPKYYTVILLIIINNIKIIVKNKTAISVRNYVYKNFNNKLYIVSKEIRHLFSKYHYYACYMKLIDIVLIF